MKLKLQKKQAPNKQPILRFIPVFFSFLFIIWIIINADLGVKNPFVCLTQQIPWGDKIGHICVFGCLTLLLNQALSYSFFNLFKLNFLTGSILILSFALVEECSQLFFATRSFDLGDILSDLLGVFGASMLVYKRTLSPSE